MLHRYLLVTPKDNEIVEQTVGMVPIRISIMVTLRELRPVAGRGMLHVSFKCHTEQGPSVPCSLTLALLAMSLPEHQKLPKTPQQARVLLLAGSIWSSQPPVLTPSCGQNECAAPKGVI